MFTSEIKTDPSLIPFLLKKEINKCAVQCFLFSSFSFKIYTSSTQTLKLYLIICMQEDFHP